MQLPNVSKQSLKREAEPLEDSEAERREEDHLFSTEELTEIEKRRLKHKRFHRDVDAAKSEDERTGRCCVVEEKTRKVGHTRGLRV